MQLKIDTIDKHRENIYYTEKDKDGNKVKKMIMNTEKKCNNLKYKVEHDKFFKH